MGGLHPNKHRWLNPVRAFRSFTRKLVVWSGALDVALPWRREPHPRDAATTGAGFAKQLNQTHGLDNLQRFNQVNQPYVRGTLSILRTPLNF